MSRPTVRLLALFLLLIAAAASWRAQQFEPDDPRLKWAQRPLAFRHPVPYFISEPALSLGGRTYDAELARWALDVWEQASDGAICLYPSAATYAWLRIYWGEVPDSRIGIMQSILVGRFRGAEVYARVHPGGPVPELNRRAAEDPLLRDVIVYITLVHEIGHGLGMVHSISIDDVMYFGGDPVQFYERYRQQIQRREDLQSLTVLSPEDTSRLQALYSPIEVKVPKKQ